MDARIDEEFVLKYASDVVGTQAKILEASIKKYSFRKYRKPQERTFFRSEESAVAFGEQSGFGFLYVENSTSETILLELFKDFTSNEEVEVPDEQRRAAQRQIRFFVPGLLLTCERSKRSRSRGDATLRKAENDQEQSQNRSRDDTPSEVKASADDRESSDNEEHLPSDITVSESYHPSMHSVQPLALHGMYQSPDTSIFAAPSVDSNLSAQSYAHYLPAATQSPAVFTTYSPPPGSMLSPTLHYPEHYPVYHSNSMPIPPPLHIPPMQLSLSTYPSNYSNATTPTSYASATPPTPSISMSTQIPMPMMSMQMPSVSYFPQNYPQDHQRRQFNNNYSRERAMQVNRRFQQFNSQTPN